MQGPNTLENDIILILTIIRHSTFSYSNLEILAWKPLWVLTSGSLWFVFYLYFILTWYFGNSKKIICLGGFFMVLTFGSWFCDKTSIVFCLWIMYICMCLHCTCILYIFFYIYKYIYIFYLNNLWLYTRIRVNIFIIIFISVFIA